jgi:hypothetical protein
MGSLRYAIGIRGISFLDNFYYDGTVPPFNIDFDDTLPSFKENIILDLKQKGHNVDIFINTYTSNKLNHFIEELKPVMSYITPYSYIKPGTGSTVYNKIINLFNMIVDYEKKNNIKYDYIIISRFDTLIFEKITNVFIPNNALSTVTPRDDNFFILSRNILEDVFKCFIYMNNNHILTHNYTNELTHMGIRCHTMYSHVYIQKHYPFFRTARHIFNKDNHPFKYCNYEDIFNSESEAYGFIYISNASFTPYLDPNVSVKNINNHLLCKCHKKGYVGI